MEYLADDADRKAARAAQGPIASMAVLPREPIVGPSLEELDRAGRTVETIRLAEPVAMPRVSFAFRTPGPYPLAPWGHNFDDPAFQTCKGQAFIIGRLERVTLPGDSGVILHDGVVLADSLRRLIPSSPGSLVESWEQCRAVRFLRDLPVRRVSEGRFFVAFTASWRNYAQWLQECVPNLVAFVEARRRDPALKAIVPHFAAGSFQQQSLALLGIMPDMLFELDPEDVVTFDDAWVPTHAHLWGVSPHVVASAAQLAAGVFQHFAPDELGGEARGERIYLSRRNATRTVANFAEVKALVERHGFEIVEPDAYSVPQQIAMMRRARHVIAEHGAGMANILFCRPGATVLELFNQNCVQPAFWSIASACGLRFGFIVGDHPPADESAEPEWNSNYVVPLATLEEAICIMSPSVSVGLAKVSQIGDQQADAPGTHVMRDRDLQDFTRGYGDERVMIFPSQSSRTPLPLLDENALAPEVLYEHYCGRQPPDVFVYGLDGYTCWGTGLLVRDAKVFLNADVMPPYINGDLANLPDIWAGALRNPQPRLVSYPEPLAVALHPNMVYGHFLLEMLPRLYLLGLLGQMGLDFPLLMQHSLPPWIRNFVALYYTTDQLVAYDSETEMVIAPKFIMPSMMQTHFAYHPALNLMVDDVLRRSGVQTGSRPIEQGRRIYLSRTRHAGGWHVLENEGEVEALMRDLGLEIVHPQLLSMKEQLALFAASSLIVGQYSSALHNAFFAPFGATVVALNRVNWYQSAIARLRRQRLAYIPPSDGKFRDYRLRSPEPVTFQIDVPDLRAFLRRAVL